MSEATNVKQFPSSIVPKGEAIEGVRSNQMQATSLQVEVFHIVCFIVIFAFIFAGIWKAAVKAEKAEAKDALKA